MNNLPLKIGVTGSIGMGKTTIVREIAKNNVPTWNSDDVVHILYKKGNKGYNIIQDLVPDAANNQAINRDILSDAILKNPLLLKTIETLIHPLVEIDRSNFIKINNNEKLIVFDIPLLFETSCDVWLDYTIVAIAPFSVQKKRVLARKSMTEEKFLYLHSKQFKIEKLIKKADFVLNTDAKLENLSIKIKAILKEILHHYD